MRPPVPCCGLLVTSPLGFKARVGSLIQTWQRGVCVTCSLRSPLVRHLPTSWQPAWQPSHSLPRTVSRHWWGPTFVLNFIPNWSLHFDMSLAKTKKNFHLCKQIQQQNRFLQKRPLHNTFDMFFDQFEVICTCLN